MGQRADDKGGIPFFGYMTERGPIMVSNPDMSTFDAFKALNVVYTSGHGSISDGGDNMDKRLAVLEAEVAHIKTDVSDTKRSVSSIETTVNTVDKNLAVIMVKLDNITEALSKKPSSDAVDKKISEAKLAQIIWTIGSVLTIVSIASGIIIKSLHI